MQPKQLKRIFNLIQKTGDRLIVADNSTDEVFAIMNIDDYESLFDCGFDYHDEDICECEEDECDICDCQKVISDLTEQEMLKKINNDVAEWRDVQKKKKDDELAEEILKENIKDESSAKSEGDEIKFQEEAKVEIKPAFASLSEVLTDEKYLNREFDDSPRVKSIEEEDLSGVEHTEEKFYLEPVE